MAALTPSAEKFVVGIDIDDTIACYTDDFLNRLSAHSGVPVGELRRPDSYSMDNNGWPGINSYEEYLNHHNEFVRNGMFSGATVQPYAVDALRELSEAGAYIKIITTRFCSTDPKDKALVIAETGKFLFNNEFAYDEFMISSTKDHIYADVYVDDSPSNIAKFVRAGRKVVVPNTTNYTESAAKQFDVPLMQDWKHGKALILSMMDQWKAERRDSPTFEQDALFQIS